MRDTSLQALHEVETFGRRAVIRAKVLKAFVKANRGLTDMELERITGVHCNSSAAERNRLMNLGYVRAVTSRTDDIVIERNERINEHGYFLRRSLRSGKWAHVWAITIKGARYALR